MSSLKGKKIELLPVKITNEKLHRHCSECEGIGWIETNKGYIEKCNNCVGMGYIRLCDVCGGEIESKYSTTCGTCQQKKWTEQRLKEEQIKFQNAEKLTFDNNSEKIKEFYYFYSEDYPHNEGYFEDFQDFFDAMYDKGITQETGPQYVWGTYETMIDIDIDNAIEQACENLYEGAYESISNEDYKELKDFVENWCKKQIGTTTYYPDYKFAIKVPWEEF